MTDIISTLESASKAYPEALCIPFTPEELKEHSQLISRASMLMGNFLTNHFEASLTELNRLNARVTFQDEMLASQLLIIQGFTEDCAIEGTSTITLVLARREARIEYLEKEVTRLSGNLHEPE